MITYTPESALIRPNSYGFFELKRDLVERAIEELNLRMQLAIAGIDDPTACDKVLYQILIAEN